MELTAREIKKFTSLLINTHIIYWDLGDKGFDYIGEIQKWVSSGWPSKQTKKFFTEINRFIATHHITNQEISEFIKIMDNPRKDWNDRMKKHNNGGRETRDNKGQFVETTTTYHVPMRYENGNIEMCRFNKIRYPKKCRSLRTWKLFYKMFPKQAEIDNWDGKTSDKMK